LRENVKIKEKDQFDKIFNILLMDFFPSAYLEAYKLYNENSFFLNHLKKIGSAVNVAADDRYKYLAAKILNKKGFLFTFQHGGFLGQSKLKLLELVEKKYSSKIFYWNNKQGLGMHYLSNFKKHQIDSSKQNNIILLYQTLLIKNGSYVDEASLHIKNHPYLNCLYEFYNELDLIYKNISIVKLFPQHNVNFIKKIWIKKCGNSINFAEKNRNLNLFYKSRIVILDDISTSLIELLYIGIPFLIINNKSFNDYDKKYKKYFYHLIDLNILFNSPEKASQFLNRNYSNIEEWWKNINNDKIFNKFKNEFYSTKKNYIDSITKFILSFR
jgi:putative transferase (TIGR04331 family)